MKNFFLILLTSAIMIGFLPKTTGAKEEYAKIEFSEKIKVYTGADFEKKDFSGLNLEGFSFIKCNMDDANFENANLKGALFIETEVEGANFKNANLENAVFKKSDLENANLLNANIKNASFKGSELEYAIWTDGKACSAESVGSCW